jgi:hypothetical protein
MSEIRDTAAKKLLSTIQVQAEEIRLLQAQNKDLVTATARFRKKREGKNAVIIRNHHISTYEIQKILDEKARLERKRLEDKALKEANRLVKNELSVIEKEVAERRKEARTRRASLRKEKEEAYRRYRASKRASKAAQKALDTAVKRYERNNTMELKIEVK